MAVVFNENFDNDSKLMNYKLISSYEIYNVRFQLCIDKTFMEIKHNKSLNLEVCVMISEWKI